MRTEQDFDSTVKAALHKSCGGISASEELKRRIDETICNGQEDNSMKHLSVKKLCIGVAAACLLVSGGAVFAGGASYFVSSSATEPAYTDYRDMGKAEKELGFAVDSVERFANGYAFDGVSVESRGAYTEETGKLYSIPTMDIRYRKDGKLIDLNVNEKVGDGTEGVKTKQSDVTRTCGDITLRYNEYTNKIVPSSYEMTEEDKLNEQRDDYHFVYQSVTVQEKPEEEVAVTIKGEFEQSGSGEVKAGEYVISEDGITAVIGEGFAGDESDLFSAADDWYRIEQVQIVSWEKDGVAYNLSGADLNLSADELLDMAEEILSAE